MRTFLLALLLLPMAARAAVTCGEVLSLPAHEGNTQRYAVSGPAGGAPQPPIALVLLPGGGGHVKLDAQGCPRALAGNSLVRSMALFHAAGFITALVDAPSDQQGQDGLGGFRADPRHAEDLGRVIADLRARSGAPVWVAGTSRGTISALNAAARLKGEAAPDGVVLTSILSAGTAAGQKLWVAQTVFDLPLEEIKAPVLLVGHAADTCIRSPAERMDKVAARLGAVARKQVVTVTGGPGGGAGGVEACEGRSPHGYVDQEEEVAAGIARFVRGGSY